MLTEATPARKSSVLLLFLGLSLCYLSLSPGTVMGQGYTGEETQSGERILAIAEAWLKNAPLPRMEWSRHGPLPVLFDLPFIVVGKSFVSPDFVVSFQPVLLTAALLTLTYVWMRKLCSPVMSLLLTLTGAFCTMLWPYAYIGLETKQSLLLLAAGYLALSAGTIRSRERLILFGLCCGLSVAVKSNGIVFFPAVAYLVYVQFRRDWRPRRGDVLLVLALIGSVWLLGAVGRLFAAGPGVSTLSTLGPFLVESPLHLYTNVIGIFGSPSKGLFVYAPVLLLSVFAVPRVLRTHKDTAMFALLVTGGILALLAVWRFPADEVWGPRYMHTTIAPLLICIAAARPRFLWRRETPLIALALLGLVISFLGAFYYYGFLSFAAAKAGQNTMEWMTADRNWNHVHFNARLFRTWLRGGTKPEPWTPSHLWVWVPPPDAPAWKTIDLREFCQPQSALVHLWQTPKHGINLVIFGIYLGALFLGPLVLVWAVVRNLRDQPAAVTRDLQAVR